MHELVSTLAAAMTPVRDLVTSEGVWVASIAALGAVLASIYSARQAAMTRHTISDRDVDVAERLTKLEVTVGHLVSVVGRGKR